ncbi:MAG: virulence protein, partial [Clostridiales bacterium]|nr:virulence protein [Clostridiales bacterium]
HGNLDAEHIKAYSELVSLLCKTAMEKKRVTAKPKETEGSQKYALRCYLISLGFIGDSYKESRKILLKNLPGSSAHKGGAADE